uniref:Uncharacterized protein n=1 Tax=Oryza glumipatula TaxID=40148 RepID=A0A0D9YGT7_9ORYZ
MAERRLAMDRTSKKKLGKQRKEIEEFQKFQNQVGIDRLPEVGGSRTWTGYKKGKLGMGRLATAGCSEGGSEVRQDWLRRRQGRRKGIGKRQIIGSGTSKHTC